MKLTRIHRLIRIVQILQSGRRCGVDLLSEELGISRRTLFRDIDVLKEAGIECLYDARIEEYRIDHAHFLQPLNLSLKEALSVMLMMRKMIDDRVVPLASSAMSAAMKIESVLPADVRAYCGTLLAGVEVCGLQVSDVEAVTDAMLHIEAAVANTRMVQIRYDSYYERAEIETVVHPYRVMFRKRGWYVVGHSERHGEVRSFKLERILALTPLDRSFERPTKFNVDDCFGRAWNVVRGGVRYHVEVHFSAEVAGSVDEIIWHQTQRTRFRPDGSLVFEVDVDGIDEISWWILGYGDQAVVTEPEELRALIGDHAKTLVGYYESGAQAPVTRK